MNDDELYLEALRVLKRHIMIARAALSNATASAARMERADRGGPVRREIGESLSRAADITQAHIRYVEEN